MGLISDYLEENRERVRSGYIDPCMVMGISIKPKKNYQALYQELQNYTCVDAKEKENIARILVGQVTELEQLKVAYLISDKVILEIINHGNLQSELVKDTICTMDEQLQQSYRSICELIREIDVKLDNPRRNDVQAVDEIQLRAQLLKMIIGSILQYLKNGVVMNTSGFRKVVSDCALVIKCLSNENYLQADKMVVQYYIEKEFDIKEAQYLCKNCKKHMRQEIPYCLYCYERNE